MFKAIIADTQPLYMAGTQHAVTANADIRVCATCTTLAELEAAVDLYRGAVVIVAASLRPNWGELMDRIKAAGSRAVVIAENNAPCNLYTAVGVRGIIYRNATGEALNRCVHRVIEGSSAIAKGETDPEEDSVGSNVLARLNLKERKIAGFIAQGLRNKEIAFQVGTTEQVIKNCLRSIYDKSGVSDRLELALFTIHHPTLASAVSLAIGHQLPVPAALLAGMEAQ